MQLYRLTREDRWFKGLAKHQNLDTWAPRLRPNQALSLISISIIVRSLVTVRRFAWFLKFKCQCSYFLLKKKWQYSYLWYLQKDHSKQCWSWAIICWHSSTPFSQLKCQKSNNAFSLTVINFRFIRDILSFTEPLGFACSVFTHDPHALLLHGQIIIISHIIIHHSAT